MNDFEYRRLGVATTLDTRAESEKKVNKAIRCAQLLELLEKHGPQTAKELALGLFGEGYTNTGERNMAAPRLTEMEKDGRVVVIGTKKCQITKRRVAVYGLPNEQYKDRYLELKEIKRC